MKAKRDASFTEALILLASGHFIGHLSATKWTDFGDAVVDTIGALVVALFLVGVVNLFRGAGDYFRRKREWDARRDTEL